MAANFPTTYVRAKPITKSDTVNFDFGPPDAIYVGGAGVVALVFTNDEVQNITAVAGAILPFQGCIKRVNSTNTTATVCMALYCT